MERCLNKLIIIPAFNEEMNLENTINSIRACAPEYDIIVVNDGSSDDSRRILESVGVNHIDHAVNLGIGGAVQSGYMYAAENGYDVAVQLDADGQHPAEYLPMMLDCLIRENADMVIGSRFIDNDGFQSSFMRRIGIRFISNVIHTLTNERITDPTSGLRMIGKEGIKLFSVDYPYDYPEPESTTMMLRHGYSVSEIPVKMHERQGGKSSINPAKSFYYMLKVTIAILIEWSKGRITK